ncbi:Sir2 family NAD-dependent protein deacetylase [Arthrobacter sp. HMSC08H08]|uniref:Sir2 family NAD-dependent protein deacetylase n=1 Tax=Arthrobacter sp. HMSC08H08 TaxID=1581143 RepID=UPI000AEC1FA4|nr:Sir2 family NAD-dependent protein deacetylase [Arthrobacter sp. HMSC08H08]
MPDNAGHAGRQGVTPLPRWSEEQTVFTDNPRVVDAHKAALRSLERAVGHSAEPTPDAEAREAVTRMVRGGKVLILTGAGVSTDSGIPDYRGPQGSLRRTRPMTVQEFRADPAARKRYWARAFIGHRLMNQARPNLGHRVLAEWQRRGLLSGIVTQNVDGLHEQAGAADVIALHGDMSEVECLDCGATEPRELYEVRLEAANPGYRETVTVRDAHVNPDGDVTLSDADVARFTTVACAVCGSERMKPLVVYFGENVPKERRERVEELKADSDTLLVVGSSLAVMSGYRFVLDALKRGQPTATITAGPGRADDKVDVLWRTLATPALLEVEAQLLRSQE